MAFSICWLVIGFSRHGRCRIYRGGDGYDALRAVLVPTHCHVSNGAVPRHSVIAAATRLHIAVLAAQLNGLGRGQLPYGALLGLDRPDTSALRGWPVLHQASVANIRLSGFTHDVVVGFYGYFIFAIFIFESISR